MEKSVSREEQVKEFSEEMKAKKRKESMCTHDWVSEQADDPWNYHYHCRKCGAIKSEAK